MCLSSAEEDPVETLIGLQGQGDHHFFSLGSRSLILKARPGRSQPITELHRVAPVGLCGESQDPPTGCITGHQQSENARGAAGICSGPIFIAIGLSVAIRIQDGVGGKVGPQSVQELPVIGNPVAIRVGFRGDIGEPWRGP